MKLKLTLAAGALALATASQAQNWIHDTIATGTGYLNNVYYGLENGTAKEEAANNWDIGFSTNAYSASIIANTADRGIKLYALGDDPNLFGTDLTAALANEVTANPLPLYNSNETWEQGAFNETDLAGYGWGDYNPTNHWIQGKVVFGMVTPTDTFQVFVVNKQTYQVTGAPVYEFKIAKIDGSNVVSQSLTIGGSQYVGKNFAYYDIATNAFLDREPKADKWDFMFSNYNDQNVVMGNTRYKVFGVVNQEGLKVARVDTASEFFDDISYQDYVFDTAINSIGRDWKSSGQGGVVMKDSLIYFIKVKNNDVWQLVFTHHISGAAAEEPGLVAFKKRKVYEAPNGVSELARPFSTLLVAPNPVENGAAHLVMDIKEAMPKAEISITDITGRTLFSTSRPLAAGFQQLPLSVAHYAPGFYMIHISGNGTKESLKMVIK